MSFDIIGIGCSSMDYIGVAPEYPPLDAKIELEEFSIQGGGPMATAMVTAARLGAEVSCITAIGDDQLGSQILDEFHDNNVDTSGIKVRPGARSHFSFIVVDKRTGKRNVFWNREGLTRLTGDDLSREHILSAKVLHVDNMEPEAATVAARWANDAGIPVVMDAGSLRPGVPELLEHVDILIASQRFANEYTSCSDPLDAAHIMRKGRTRVSVVTCGDKGTYCDTPEESFFVPAVPVDVVDTTGAGDVFHGAFSFGLAKGWELIENLCFASVVAAIKCTKLGGRQGIPSIVEVRKFLREREAES